MSVMLVWTVLVISGGEFFEKTTYEPMQDMEQCNMVRSIILLDHPNAEIVCTEPKEG